MLFSNYLNGQFGFSPLIVLIIPVIAFFTFCFDQLQNMLRSEDRPELFMKTGIGKLLIEFGLSVLLVVAFNWRWYGRVAGMTVSHFIIAAFGIIYFIRRGYLFGTPRKEYFRSELAYAGPVIAFQMAFFTVNSSDKFILSYFSNDDNATVGVYSIASVFASVVFTLHHALIQYVFPKIFSTLAEEQVNYGIIRKQFKFYVLAMAAAAILIIAGTPVIYRLMINPLYHGALSYLYLFCIGYFLWSVGYFFFSFLLFRKDKGRILFLSVSGIAISLAMNYWFISRWMAFGGAAAVAISCLIILLLTIFTTFSDVRKIFRIPSPKAGQ
jgi:O-antigen/teichoic acid export membrane protein